MYNKPIVIIGNSDYARMLKRYLELNCDRNILAYAVSGAYITDKVLDGIDVVSLENLTEMYPASDVELIIGIGYKKMGEIRKNVFLTCKNKGYQFMNFIHPTAIIEKNVVLGEGNVILEGAILEESVSIGDGNLIFGGVLIAHETSIGSFNSLSVNSTIAGCSVIGNNCFIGANSTVRDHVHFEDYVLLGAAAYGYKDMKAYSVIKAANSILLDGKISTDFL